MPSQRSCPGLGQVACRIPLMACACCHAQGCKALVCMPETTPEIKVKNVRRLGGTVELVGESYTETQAYAQVNA